MPLILTGRDMLVCGEHDSWYEMSDGRNDNRCMIVGHTNTAYEVIKMLQDSRPRRYKFYIGVCTADLSRFREIVKRVDPNSTVYIAPQENIRIEGQRHQACEFLPTDETGLDFKAMRSELIMFNATCMGFHNKLENRLFAKLSNKLRITDTYNEIEAQPEALASVTVAFG